ARAMLAVGAHAATDITGFGLIGHLASLSRARGVAARISAGAVPLLPHARELAEGGHVPGGTRRNFEDVAAAVAWADNVDETARTLLCDAQTSGGLLIAVAEERAEELLEALRAERTPVAVRIGEIAEGPPGSIIVDD
ncbi:MAG: AIR synthase-related protein, partial [Longimicrobiales bacterium]